MGCLEVAIIAKMEAEAIIITHVDGLSHFSGYYFSERITPRVWLKDELSKAKS